MIGRDAISVITGDPLSPAVRAFQQGRLHEAREMLRVHAARHGMTTTAEYYLGLIERRLAPTATTATPALLWHDGTGERPEAEWLRRLLHGIATPPEHPDAPLPPRAVVVDADLSPEKQLWYRDAFLAGCDVTLLHLGDAAHDQDCGVYRWCRHVFRNYYAPALAPYADVHFLPLGSSPEFQAAGEPKPAQVRLHLWSFAGNPDRPTRHRMLAAMAELGSGPVHLTPEREPLTPGAYRALLAETVVAPCPAGATSLDTTRVTEALEAGCLPIVERREGFDYFRLALGTHPLPTVSDWAEAPALVRDLQQSDRLEVKRSQCHAWWRHYKGHLVARLTAALRA